MEIKEIRRANLLQLAEELDGLHGVAERTGVDAKYLSQVKNRWQGRGMGDDVARRIEEGLHKPRGWMDVLQVPANRAADPSAVADVDRYGPGVAVVGTAQLGDDGYWHELEYPTGHGEGFVRYPMKDPNTYALRVKGDSMRPRIKPGEFVVIEPNQRVVVGEEVMVQTKDGRCMIKQLGSRKNGLVELLSVNEDHRPITLDEEQIAKIHHVAAILKSSLYYEKL